MADQGNTRRDFLKATSAVAAGAAIGSVGLADTDAGRYLEDPQLQPEDGLPPRWARPGS